MGKEAQQLGFGGEFASTNRQKPVIRTGVESPVSPDAFKPVSEKGAWRKDKPTDGQRVFITRLCLILGEKELLEEKVANKMEAGRVIGELKSRLKVKNLKNKSNKRFNPR